jgi:hypothetical protein
MAFIPFRETSSYGAFQHRLDGVLGQIRELENSMALGTAPSELEARFLKDALIEPLILHTDQLHQLNRKTIPVDGRMDPNLLFFPGDKVFNVAGTELSLAIPFEGDRELWKVQPSSSLGGCPEIEVTHETIVFRYVFADAAAANESKAAELRRKIDNHVNSITSNVENLARDIEQYNERARERVTKALEQKRSQALAALNMVASLGIPLKSKSEPATYIAPVQRRVLPVIRPTHTIEPYKPEPELEEAAYQHILKVTRSASVVMERDPASFNTLGEEALRSLMLILLNGHYEGTATGETFNGEGKTDILIRVNNRNIFIGECKIWSGQAKFKEAIDQLLGYITWRDCKCALLVFNRQKNSTNVAEKMHEAMTTHSGHRKTVSHDVTGDSRYIYVKESDLSRELIITTQLFDIPSGS